MVRFTRWVGEIGDVQHSSWFALLPVTIGNETRWLEWVTVLWQLQEVPDFFPPCALRPKWVKVDFLDAWPEE